MKNYFAISAFTALVIATAFFGFSNLETPAEEPDPGEGVEQFESEKEFREYISGSDSTYGTVGRAGNFNTALESSGSAGDTSGTTGSTVERSSDTNIQVAGVQEPDILKNGGEKIYYSSENNDYSFYYSDREERNTSVFNTLPAKNFSETGNIPRKGEMFLTDNSIIFLGDKLSSYSRQNHTKNWDLGLNSTIESARRINESIYLVMRETVSAQDPCPVRPLESVSMPCTDFYRPSGAEGGDMTYTLSKIDAETGEVEENTGFIGSGQNTVVYMSRNSVYLTYYTQKSETEIRMDFIEERGTEFLDQETMNRIEEVQSYDISDEALRIELSRAIARYRDQLPEEEASEFRKEVQNAWGNYTDNRKRELSTTGIAEFDRDLELQAEGSVPGEVNDQFSISEKNGDLRIATTVGNSWQFDAESANDLYVLDEELDRKGEIQGLGLTEQIYSVRYVNDKAYIVTFRRVDPFHTVDLSDPSDPELEGELKLPGYSSYLHPLSDDRILGIGEEDGQVKAVIFDVSESEPEIEESKVLDDWYSEISNSHHAFKIDRKHEVFFLPGSEGGHVFDYSEGLEQVKEVNMTDVKRATYVNDNLYVFSDTDATVLDENTWETVRELQFREPGYEGPVEPPVIDPPVVR